MNAETVRRGKLVSLTYTLINQNGEVFEQCDVPVTYLHGLDSGLFEKVEQALEGKTAGDKVQVSLSPDEGFGAHNPGMTFTDELDNVPPELRFVGARLEAQNASGETLHFIVTHIDHDKLTVDGNHPLAGQTVQFHVIIQDVRTPTAEELQRSQNGGSATLQ
jgi:FKBP-type peptidyl-prolyl cis-trans isomerase SlyD